MYYQRLFSFKTKKNTDIPVYKALTPAQIRYEGLRFVSDNRLPNLYWTYVIHSYVTQSPPKVEASFCDSHEMPQIRRLRHIEINKALNSDSKIN